MGRRYFSIWKFTEHFKDKNYSLFKRKKDLCNVCLGYKEGNIGEEMYVEHIQRKEDGLELKERDKCSADNIPKFVFTADTDALSLAQLSDANVMFFHSKLNVHNFTFFDLKTKDVMNYLWTEVNGLIESDNFISCCMDYLNDLLDKFGNNSLLIIWSDGCTYQNKCSNLSSALLSFAVGNNITIYHKYLEVGHTHMEVVSVCHN